MIIKYFKEKNHDKMTDEQKKQHDEICHAIENEDTEYIVAVDLARPDSEDYSVLVKLQQDNNGRLVVHGIEKFK